MALVTPFHRVRNLTTQSSSFAEGAELGLQVELALGLEGPVLVSAAVRDKPALKRDLTRELWRRQFALRRRYGEALCFSGTGHTFLLFCPPSTQWESRVEGFCSLRRWLIMEEGGKGLGMLTSCQTAGRMAGNSALLCAETSCKEGSPQQPVCSPFINTPVHSTLLFSQRGLDCFLIFNFIFYQS